MKPLSLVDVSYTYAGTEKEVLNSLNYDFEDKTIYGIMGKSGSGKTTLLSLLAGLDKATKSSILVHGNDLANVNRDAYRAKTIGVVFQGYNLLNNANAIENIILSMNISGSKITDKKTYALNLLEKVGISEEKAYRKVLKLSGGEQQRVGIARALSHNPDIILADEPTGNLDGDTEAGIMKLFKDLAQQEGKCVIVVSHSQYIRNEVDFVIDLDKGKIVNGKRK